MATIQNNQQNSIIASTSVENNEIIGRKLAPFNPTNLDCIGLALTMLCMGDNERLFDLGCGDGRFVIEAVKMNRTVQAIGVEYDLALCSRARANAKRILDATQAARCVIYHDNVLNIDLSHATSMFIYLVPEGLSALKDALIRSLERGTRIVTYVFSIPGLIPHEVQRYKCSTKLYLYTEESVRDIDHT